MAEQSFDVFLCHNSEDKPAVIQIAERLQQYDLRPWLDVWELRPGAVWQFVLEQQIESIGAAAVFVGHQGLGPWQKQEIYAFLQEFLSRGCPVIPVLLHDAPQQPKLPIFLKNIHWVDFRQTDPDTLVQLIWGITGKKPKLLQKPVQTPDLDVPSVAQTPVAPLPRAYPPTTPFPAPAIPVNATPRIPTEEPVPLKSEKGVDYRKLRDLLETQDWKAADSETYLRMLEAVGREGGDWIRADELLNFPCADLKTIDGLWVHYSRGRFGFSVQKKIYLECGGKPDGTYPGDKIWETFGDRVGWRVNKKWISYSGVNFDTQAPKGHLPWFLWGGREVGVLFSRIETCKV